MKQIKLPDRKALPEHLVKHSNGRVAGWIIFDWSAIAGAIWLALAFPGALTYLVAITIIASRQHALFILLHEGVHYHIAKGKWQNDWITNLFAAWPVGLSTEKYRLRHWLHHRYLNTEADPDWQRKQNDPTWSFPMSSSRFWRATSAHLFGKGIIEMIYALRGIGVSGRELKWALPYYFVLAAAITASGAWREFFLFWVVPYFTLAPFFHRVRNAVEHLALPHTHSLNTARNIMASKLETFLFGPHNINFHLVHHLYPFIPAYRLEEAREYLLQHEQFRNLAHENDSYLMPWGKSVFRDMVPRSSPPAAEERPAA